MGKKLDSNKVQGLREGYFENPTLAENSKAAGCSIGAAHTHVRAFESEIDKEGLMPTLEKWGLTEAKEVAQLLQEVKQNSTTPQQCFQAIPIAHKMAAGHIKPEDMSNVIDQVLSKCTPEMAPEVGAAIVEYARERASNKDLSINQVRTEYHNLTLGCQRLSEQFRVLTGSVNNLTSQATSLSSQVDALHIEHRTLSQELAQESQTGETLRQYVSDKAYLASIGVDIMNVRRARPFFDEVERHGYNGAHVCAQLLNIPPLSAASRALTQQLTDLIRKKTTLEAEIPELENKRREAMGRTQEAEKDADAKVAASQKRIEEQLAKEKLTLDDIEDTKKFKEELREAGFDT